MTKAELSAVVAEKSSMTKSASKDFVDTVFNTVIEALESGENVEICGLGKLKVVDCKATVRRNFKTKEPMEVPAHKAIRFSASSNLKKAVKAL